MDQSVRDAVGTTLLELTLRELFVWRFMQTDPNWGNFLFDAPSGRLHLIDFGAPPRLAHQHGCHRKQHIDASISGRSRKLMYNLLMQQDDLVSWCVMILRAGLG